jgi:hypothetical protein
MKRAYFVVEGPHDVEFVGRLLKFWGLKRVQQEKKLHDFWRPLVPTTYPPQGDLLRRVPVPTFLASADVEVAVNAAVGDSQLARMLNAELGSATFEASALDAVALVLDADDKAPLARWTGLRTQIAVPTGFPLVLPAEPNTVSTSRIRGGALVLPGDGRQGTLETLLLETGALAYPTFLREAEEFVRRLDQEARVDALAAELVDFDTSSGRRKAHVAAAAVALRPGKAIQTSIQDNRWIDEAARAVPALAACLDFVARILDVPLPAPGT